MDILIADHHPVFRRGLKYMMKDHPSFKFKGKVEDGKDLMKAIAQNQPDILILEVDLPNSDGVGSLRRIRAEYTDLKILVISCHPEEIYAESSVKAGANGYIAKTRSVKETRKALLEVSEGGTFLPKEIQSQMSERQNGHMMKYKRLSTREIEVLNLLSRGKRNKEIAQQLSINEKTVSTYKTRLLKKLNVDNIADLIHQSRLLQLTS